MFLDAFGCFWAFPKFSMVLATYGLWMLKSSKIEAALSSLCSSSASSRVRQTTTWQGRIWQELPMGSGQNQAAPGNPRQPKKVDGLWESMTKQFQMTQTFSMHPDNPLPSATKLKPSIIIIHHLPLHWQLSIIYSFILHHLYHLSLSFIIFIIYQPSSTCHMEVSRNGGTTKSSISMGFSFVNHPFGGTPF